jgi:hypothetical protein
MIGFNGQNLSYNPLQLNGVTSHDFKLGLRWSLNASDNYGGGFAVPAYSPPAPVYTPPAPAYSPPPPLMRKG